MSERSDSSRPEEYTRAARFTKEREALRAYERAQELILRTPCDLSTYRLQINQVWHVAILGDPPAEDVDRRIERILDRGELAELPEDVLDLLRERGKRMRAQSSWAEGHYRPGWRILDQ